MENPWSSLYVASTSAGSVWHPWSPSVPQDGPGEVSYDNMMPLNKLPEHWVYSYIVISHVTLTDGHEKYLVNYLLYLWCASAIKVLSCHNDIGRRTRTLFNYWEKLQV